MKKLILLTALIVSSFATQAQDIEQLLVSGKDAETMLQAYLKPAFEGTISNLNNGWYRTAKPHKLLGFDITLNASLASVPNGAKNFTFRNSDYENITLKSGATEAELPTSFGGKSNETLLFSQTGTFTTPDGRTITGTRSIEFDPLESLTDEIGLDDVPSAMIQAGIGLPFKTDITVRYVPEVGGDDFKTDLIGFGIKHNIIQYFPIAKRIPLVDVSLFAGYTKLTSQYVPGENQSIDMEIKTFTGQLLASIDLKIINLFAGFGYSKGESTLSASGDYTFDYEINGTVEELRIDQEDLPNIKSELDGFTTTAGLSLNLAFFKIYGSYTLQEYNALNAGIAFSFR